MVAGYGPQGPCKLAHAGVLMTAYAAIATCFELYLDAPCQTSGRRAANVLTAERAAKRRLINLKYADFRKIMVRRGAASVYCRGSSDGLAPPRAGEGSPTVAYSAVSTLHDVLLVQADLAVAEATSRPTAQMKPASSRATAVQTCTFILPLALSAL